MITFDPFRLLFLVPDTAWKTRRKKIKIRPNTKLVPIIKGRNNKLIDVKLLN